MPNKRNQKNLAPRVENSLYRVHTLDDNTFIRDLNLRLYVNDLTGTAISAQEIANSVDLRRALTGNIKIDGTRNNVEMVRVVLEKEYATKEDDRYKIGTITFEQEPMYFTDGVDARKELSPYRTRELGDNSSINYLLPVFFVENCAELKELIKGHKVLNKIDKVGNVYQEDTLIPAAYDGMVVLVKDPSDMTSLTEPSIAIFKADTEKIVIKNRKDKFQRRETSICDRTGKGAFIFNNGESIKGKKEGFGPSISTDYGDIKDLIGANINIKSVERTITGVKIALTGADLVNFTLDKASDISVKINGSTLTGCSYSSDPLSDGLDIIIEFPPTLSLNFKDKMLITLPEGLVSADIDEDGDGIPDTGADRVISSLIPVTLLVEPAKMPDLTVDVIPISGNSGMPYNGAYSVTMDSNPSALTIKNIHCTAVPNLFTFNSTAVDAGTIAGAMPNKGDVNLTFEISFNETHETVKKVVTIKNEKIDIPTSTISLSPASGNAGMDYNGAYTITLNNPLGLTVKDVVCISNDGMTVNTTAGLTGTVVGRMPLTGDVTLKFEVSYVEITQKTPCTVILTSDPVTLPTAIVNVVPDKCNFGVAYTGNYTITLSNATGFTVDTVTCACSKLTVDTTNGLTGPITGTFPSTGNVPMTFTISFIETSATINCAVTITGEGVTLPTVSVTLDNLTAYFDEAYTGNYIITMPTNPDGLTIKNVTITDTNGLKITQTDNEHGIVNGTFPSTGNVTLKFEVEFNETTDKVTETVVITGSALPMPTASIVLNPANGKYNLAYNGAYTISLAGNTAGLTVKTVTCTTTSGMTVNTAAGLTGTVAGTMPATGNVPISFEIEYNETSKKSTVGGIITGVSVDLPTATVVVTPTNEINEMAVNGTYVITLTGGDASLTVKKVTCATTSGMTINTTAGLTGTIVGNMPATGDATFIFDVEFNEVTDKVSCTESITGTALVLPTANLVINPASVNNGFAINSTYSLGLTGGNAALTVKNVTCSTPAGITVVGGENGTITGTMVSTGDANLVFTVTFNETGKTLTVNGKITGTSATMPTATVTIDNMNQFVGEAYSGNYAITLTGGDAGLTVKNVTCAITGLTANTTAGLNGTITGTMPNNNVVATFTVSFNEVSNTVTCTETITKVTLPTATASVTSTSAHNGMLVVDGAYAITLAGDTGLTVKNVTCVCADLVVNTTAGLTGTITGTMPVTGNVSMVFTVSFNEITQSITCNGIMNGTAIPMPTATLTLTPASAYYNSIINDGKYQIALIGGDSRLTVNTVTCTANGGMTVNTTTGLNGGFTGTFPNTGNVTMSFEVTFVETTAKVTCTETISGLSINLPKASVALTPDNGYADLDFNGAYAITLTDNTLGLTIKNVTCVATPGNVTVNCTSGLTGTITGNMVDGSNETLKFTISFNETTDTLDVTKTLTVKSIPIPTATVALTPISVDHGYTITNGSYAITLSGNTAGLVVDTVTCIADTGIVVNCSGGLNGIVSGTMVSTGDANFAFTITYKQTSVTTTCNGKITGTTHVDGTLSALSGVPSSNTTGAALDGTLKTTLAINSCGSCSKVEFIENDTVIDTQTSPVAGVVSYIYHANAIKASDIGATDKSKTETHVLEAKATFADGHTATSGASTVTVTRTLVEPTVTVVLTGSQAVMGVDFEEDYTITVNGNTDSLAVVSVTGSGTGITTVQNTNLITGKVKIASADVVMAGHTVTFTVDFGHGITKTCTATITTRAHKNSTISALSGVPASNTTGAALAGTLSVTITDNDCGTCTGVEFFDDATSLGISAVSGGLASCAFNIPALVLGITEKTKTETHKFKAVATFTDGHTASTTVSTVTVSKTLAEPTVSVALNPTNAKVGVAYNGTYAITIAGNTDSLPYTITSSGTNGLTLTGNSDPITGTATIDAGDVVMAGHTASFSVDFGHGIVKTCSASLTVSAHSNATLSALSGVPTGNITGAALTGTLSTTITENDCGTVTKVEFYDDTTLLGTGTISSGVASYALSIPAITLVDMTSKTLTVTHKFKAVATFADGHTASTSVETVTVSRTLAEPIVSVALNPTNAKVGVAYNGTYTITIAGNTDSLPYTITSSGTNGMVITGNSDPITGTATIASGDVTMSGHTASFNVDFGHGIVKTCTASLTVSAHSNATLSALSGVPADKTDGSALTETLTTTITENDCGTVTKVEFYDDTILLGTGTISSGVASYTLAIPAIALSDMTSKTLTVTHKFKAVATFTDGHTASSAVATMKVTRTLAEPTVSASLTPTGAKVGVAYNGTYTITIAGNTDSLPYTITSSGTNGLTLAGDPDPITGTATIAAGDVVMAGHTASFSVDFGHGIVKTCTASLTVAAHVDGTLSALSGVPASNTTGAGFNGVLSVTPTVNDCGSVTNVEFFDNDGSSLGNGTLNGTDYETSYAYAAVTKTAIPSTDDSITITYKFKAVATFADGHTATSPVETVTVKKTLTVGDPTGSVDASGFIGMDYSGNYTIVEGTNDDALVVNSISVSGTGASITPNADKLTGKLNITAAGITAATNNVTFTIVYEHGITKTCTVAVSAVTHTTGTLTLSGVPTDITDGSAVPTGTVSATLALNDCSKCTKVEVYEDDVLKNTVSNPADGDVINYNYGPYDAVTRADLPDGDASTTVNHKYKFTATFDDGCTASQEDKFDVTYTATPFTIDDLVFNPPTINKGKDYTGTLSVVCNESDTAGFYTSLVKVTSPSGVTINADGMTINIPASATVSATGDKLDVTVEVAFECDNTSGGTDKHGPHSTATGQLEIKTVTGTTAKARIGYITDADHDFWEGSYGVGYDAFEAYDIEHGEGAMMSAEAAIDLLVAPNTAALFGTLAEVDPPITKQTFNTPSGEGYSFFMVAIPDDAGLSFNVENAFGSLNSTLLSTTYNDGTTNYTIYVSAMTDSDFGVPELFISIS